MASPRALCWAGVTGPDDGRDGARDDGPDWPRVEGPTGPKWLAHCRAHHRAPCRPITFPPNAPSPNAQRSYDRWLHSPPSHPPLQRSHDRCSFIFFYFFFTYFFSINTTQILLIFHQLSLNFSYSLQIHFFFTICSHFI